MFWDMAVLVCMDDKHRVKFGEPDVPVVVAERGGRVLVSLSDTFEVYDHDFTQSVTCGGYTIYYGRVLV